MDTDCILAKITIMKNLFMANNNERPAWMNWAYLGIFLWSSWQIANFWINK